MVGLGYCLILITLAIAGFVILIRLLDAFAKIWDDVEGGLNEREEEDFFEEVFGKDEPIHGHMVNGEKDAMRTLRRGARRGSVGSDMTPMKRVTRKK